MKLGRDGEAQEAANEAVGQSGLDAFSRQAAHWILAATAITAAEDAGSTVAAVQSWRRAEHHLAECVRTADGLRANPRDVWNLIHVQMKLGDPARAHATLSAHDPEIRSKQDAVLYAAVVETQPGTAEVFARMLDLADRFDDDPQFSGMLLSAVVARTRDEGQEPATPADTRVELAQDLRAQAFAAFTRHAERHGDASPIRIFQGLTTEDLVAKMTRVHASGSWSAAGPCRDDPPGAGPLRDAGDDDRPPVLFDARAARPRVLHRRHQQRRRRPGRRERRRLPPATRTSSWMYPPSWSHPCSANSTTRAGSSGRCSRRRPPGRTSQRAAGNSTGGRRAADRCPTTTRPTPSWPGNQTSAATWQRLSDSRSWSRPSPGRS